MICFPEIRRAAAGMPGRVSAGLTAHEPYVHGLSWRMRRRERGEIGREKGGEGGRVRDISSLMVKSSMAVAKVFLRPDQGSEDRQIGGCEQEGKQGKQACALLR